MVYDSYEFGKYLTELRRRILRIWYFLMSMSVGRFGRK